MTEPGPERVYQMMKNADDRRKIKEAMSVLKKALQTAIRESDWFACEVIESSYEPMQDAKTGETYTDDVVITFQLPLYLTEHKKKKSP